MRFKIKSMESQFYGRGSSKFPVLLVCLGGFLFLFQLLHFLEKGIDFNFEELSLDQIWDEVVFAEDFLEFYLYTLKFMIDLVPICVFSLDRLNQVLLMFDKILHKFEVLLRYLIHFIAGQYLKLVGFMLQVKLNRCQLLSKVLSLFEHLCPQYIDLG